MHQTLAHHVERAARELGTFTVRDVQIRLLDLQEKRKIRYQTMPTGRELQHFLDTVPFALVIKKGRITTYQYQVMVPASTNGNTSADNSHKDTMPGPAVSTPKSAPAGQKPKHPGGRPSKFTDDNLNKLYMALRAGADRPTACTYAGLSHRVFQDWMHRARGGSRRFKQFLQDVENAEMQTRMKLLLRVQKSAEVDPKIALRLLESLWPDRFGRKERVQGDVQHTGTVKLIFEDVEGRNGS